MNLHFGTIVAQFVDDAKPLLFAYGPLGLIVAWFMLRAERGFDRVGDLAHRIDGLTRALLMDMIERAHTSETTKRYAEQMIAKIEARSSKGDRR